MTTQDEDTPKFIHSGNIVYEDGIKGEGDKRVIWMGHWVEMPEIAEIVCQLYKNEQIDSRYPPSRCRENINGSFCRKTQSEHIGFLHHYFKPFMGGKYLLYYLQECCEAGGVTDEINRKYRLGQYRPKESS